MLNNYHIIMWQSVVFLKVISSCLERDKNLTRESILPPLHVYNYCCLNIWRNDKIHRVLAFDEEWSTNVLNFRHTIEWVGWLIIFNGYLNWVYSTNWNLSRASDFFQEVKQSSRYFFSIIYEVLSKPDGFSHQVDFSIHISSKYLII